MARGRRYLIEFSGKKWTRFHLPTHDQAGDTSEKFDVHVNDWQSEKWVNWCKIILQKLGAAKEFRWGTPDNRAQLQGVCFIKYFGLSSNPPKPETEQQKQDRALHINAEWARFGERVVFDSSSFSTYEQLNEASFDYGAMFNGASFGHDTNFNNASFGDRSQFNNASFGDRSQFNNASFGRSTEFNNADFGKSADFNNASFGYDTQFNNVIFGEDSYFYSINFGDLTHFNNASFGGSATFTDAKFGAGLRFYKTKFMGLAKFHGCQLHQNSSFAEAEFNVPIESDSDLAEQYQNAFQSLRQHMENLRNHEQERKFSKLEMQAREVRSDSNDVPMWVRLLSRAYGLFADYGQSAVRPLIGIIALFLAASGAYWLIAGDDADWSGAIGTAFQS